MQQEDSAISISFYNIRISQNGPCENVKYTNCARKVLTIPIDTDKLRYIFTDNILTILINKGTKTRFEIPVLDFMLFHSKKDLVVRFE